MTVIIFLLDTSASMSQKNYKGCSTLDICKNFIYEFVKARGRDSTAKIYDRYILVTTEDYPFCVKELRSPWRENVLLDSLKQVESHGCHNFCKGLTNVFRVINAHRNSTGIETYGYGRTPYYIEPVIIVSMTDGFGISDLPQEIKVEQFDTRWDQRLFTLVLRLPAQANRFPGRVDSDQENIEKLCTSNGGRSFSVVNHKQMSSCFDQIFQSFSHLGVGVRFLFPQNAGMSKNGTERVSTQAELLAEARLKKDLEAKPIITLLVRNAQAKPVTGHWPIPEAFWHTRLENGNLPTRSTHPSILFMLDLMSVHMIADYPFDKYDLEPSCLSDFIIERLKTTPDKCMQVFVRNSGKLEGVGKPFGFLKPNTAGTAVTLFIMPYNYPVILSLVEECKADSNVRNNANWKKRLDNYLETVPPYYISNLKKTLGKLSIAGGLLDDPTVNKRMYVSSINQMINQLKSQGVENMEKLQSTVSHAIKLPAPQAQSQMTLMERRPKLASRRHWKIECDQIANKVKRADKERDRTSDKDMIFRDICDSSIENVEKFKTQVHFADPRVRITAGSIFKNPFNIPKTDLIEQIPRLNANMGMFLRNTHFSLLEGGRAGFSIKLHNADELHNLPISIMGNYDDYIKAKINAGGGPLREIDPKPVRSNAFGSPFKTKGISVDEVGENTLSPVEQNGTKEHRRRDRGRPPKRKAGPLATNAMRDWRDKRKSNSECSSVASDMSYITDLDVEKPSCSGTSVAENGNMETDENHGSFTTGYLEEAPLSSSDLNGEQSYKCAALSDSEMRARKILISSIVRRPGNGLILSRELARTVNDGNVNDRCLLLQFALRESLRFKRKGLSADIQSQIDQFKIVLKSV